LLDDETRSVGNIQENFNSDFVAYNLSSENWTESIPGYFSNLTVYQCLSDFMNKMTSQLMANWPAHHFKQLVLLLKLDSLHWLLLQRLVYHRRRSVDFLKTTFAKQRYYLFLKGLMLKLML
jgi:hypothetical protein